MAKPRWSLITQSPKPYWHRRIDDVRLVPKTRYAAVWAHAYVDYVKKYPASDYGRSPAVSRRNADRILFDLLDAEVDALEEETP